eukprot:3703074-Rhodomonas_salina.1
MQAAPRHAVADAAWPAAAAAPLRLQHLLRPHRPPAHLPPHVPRTLPNSFLPLSASSSFPLSASSSFCPLSFRSASSSFVVVTLSPLSLLSPLSSSTHARLPPPPFRPPPPASLTSASSLLLLLPSPLPFLPPSLLSLSPHTLSLALTFRSAVTGATAHGHAGSAAQRVPRVGSLLFPWHHVRLRSPLPRLRSPPPLLPPPLLPRPFLLLLLLFFVLLLFLLIFFLVLSSFFSLLPRPPLASCPPAPSASSPSCP